MQRSSNKWIIFQHFTDGVQRPANQFGKFHQRQTKQKGQSAVSVARNLFTGLEWIGCWFAFCDMQMRGDLLRFFQFDGRSGWFLSRTRWTVLAAVQKRLKDAAAGWFAYLVQSAPFPALHERQVDARRIRVGWMEAAAVAGSWATRWRKWAAGDFKIWTSVRRFRRRWTEIGRIVVQKRLVNPAERFLGDLIQSSFLAAFNKRPVN